MEGSLAQGPAGQQSRERCCVAGRAPGPAHAPESAFITNDSGSVAFIVDAPLRDSLPGRCHGRWESRVHPRWQAVLGTLLLLLGLLSHLAPVSWAQGGAGSVVVVQIRNEIDLGLAPYLARALEQARRENARAA